ncbi:MAG: diphthine--ammonia ligase [Thermoplasmata archaeon]|nr:diphthine--ammonia ligase [Thermoplasmata archaeon]
MGILCLSGGKDSVYAGYLAMQMGLEIKRSLIFLPEQTDSYMFHCPNIRIASLVAECMGLEPVEIPVQGDEVESIEKAFGGLEEEYVITGAIASEYQKERFERVAYITGKKCISPLWRRNELGLLREIVDSGMRVIFVGRFAEGLGDEWLGRELDEEAIEELAELHRQFGINPSGEGGEYETLVLDAPFFHRRLRIVSTVLRSGIHSGMFDVEVLAEAKN